MASPLSGLISNAIGKALNSTFLPATLTRAGEPTGPAFDPTPGTPQRFTCRAIVDTYSDHFKTGGLVTAKDRKVLILATSLATRPEEGDIVTVNGGASVVIHDAEVDPAGALWTCKATI